MQLIIFHIQDINTINEEEIANNDFYNDYYAGDEMEGAGDSYRNGNEDLKYVDKREMPGRIRLLGKRAEGRIRLLKKAEGRIRLLKKGGREGRLRILRK